MSNRLKTITDEFEVFAQAMPAELPVAEREGLRMAFHSGALGAYRVIAEALRMDDTPAAGVHVEAMRRECIRVLEEAAARVEQAAKSSTPQ